MEMVNNNPHDEEDNPIDIGADETNVGIQGIPTIIREPGQKLEASELVSLSIGSVEMKLTSAIRPAEYLVALMLDIIDKITKEEWIEKPEAKKTIPGVG